MKHHYVAFTNSCKAFTIHHTAFKSFHTALSCRVIFFTGRCQPCHWPTTTGRASLPGQTMQLRWESHHFGISKGNSGNFEFDFEKSRSVFPALGFIPENKLHIWSDKNIRKIFSKPKTKMVLDQFAVRKFLILCHKMFQ